MASTQPDPDPLHDFSVPPAGSNPELSAARQRIQNAHRRRIKSDMAPKPTMTHDVPSSQDLAAMTAQQPAQIRAAVFQAVQRKLRESRIDPMNYSELFFAWMLPRNNASLSDWDAFMESPMLVPNTQLRSMFNLKQSTAADVMIASSFDVRRFYFRSFPITAVELGQLIEAMSRDDYGDEALRGWADVIGGLKKEDQDKVLFVRYCGQTTEPSVWVRHAGDLRSVGGILISAFFRYCREVCPHVIDAAEVFEFVDGQMHKDLDTSLVDLREQALIALFDIDTLLNTELGGFHRRFEPQDGDEELFNALQTSTYHDMFAHATPCDGITGLNMIGYTLEVQKYTEQHPGTTNTARYPITDNVRAMYSEQGRPARVNSQTIFLTIGSDITSGGITNPRPFYAGRFPSGDLCKEIINQLGTWETSAFTYQQQEFVAKRMMDAGHLPFVNLYPWPRKDPSDLPAAINLLRGYLRLTKPLIILTFSEHVSSVAAGGFQHAYGMKERQFTDAIGSILESKYDEDADLDEDEYCCLIVPCYHPGSIKYKTEMGLLFEHLLSKIYTIVWLAMHKAIPLVNEGTLSRKQICQSVKEQVDASTNINTKFGQSIRDSKAKIMQLRGSMFSRAQHKRVVVSALQSNLISYSENSLLLDTAQARWKRAEDQLRQVVLCGIAAPTAVRQEQVKRLQGLQYALLNTPKAGRGAAFIRWASAVPLNESFYYHATKVAERLSDIPDLLSIFVEGNVDQSNGGWKEDATAVAATDGMCQSWLVGKALKFIRFDQDPIAQTLRVFTALREAKDPELCKQLRAQAITQANTNVEQQSIPIIGAVSGSQIIVRPDFAGDKRVMLQLRWTDEQAVTYSLKNVFLPSGVLPADPHESRFIFLVADGIDIRDAQDISLGVRGDSKVTLPLASLMSVFSTNQNGTALRKLWERETGLDILEALFGKADEPITIDEDVVQSYPQIFFAGTSRPLRVGGSMQKMIAAFEKQRPFVPADAVWLVNQFLIEEYPSDDETIHLGNPAHWIDDNGMWERFERWLERNRVLYRHHPQLIDLRAECSNSRDQFRGRSLATVMSAVLSVIRMQCDKSSVSGRPTPGHKRTKVVCHVTGGVRSAAFAQVDQPDLESYNVDDVAEGIGGGGGGGDGDIEDGGGEEEGEDLMSAKRKHKARDSLPDDDEQYREEDGGKAESSEKKKHKTRKDFDDDDYVDENEMLLT